MTTFDSYPQTKCNHHTKQLVSLYYLIKMPLNVGVFVNVNISHLFTLLKHEE